MPDVTFNLLFDSLAGVTHNHKTKKKVVGARRRQWESRKEEKIVSYEFLDTRSTLSFIWWLIW